MHAGARAFVEHNARAFGRVIEFGSRDINGGVRDLFAGCDTYTGVDQYDGNGVDLVADITTLDLDHEYDTVVCCELLEHQADTDGILDAAARALMPGGKLILTCATDPRGPHSAVDGGPLRDGEHYENVDADELLVTLERHGFASAELTVVQADGDLYCLATREP